MSAKKIAEYLLTTQSYITSNKKFREASKISLTIGKLTVLNQLGNRKLIIPKTNHKSVDLVEYNITNNKLK